MIVYEMDLERRTVSRKLKLAYENTALRIAHNEIVGSIEFYICNSGIITGDDRMEQE